MLEQVVERALRLGLVLVEELLGVAGRQGRRAAVEPEEGRLEREARAGVDVAEAVWLAVPGANAGKVARGEGEAQPAGEAQSFLVCGALVAHGDRFRMQQLQQAHGLLEREALSVFEERGR